MNELQVFENKEFGKIRTVEIDNKPYFVGKDVAVILGYTNPQKAIRDHIDKEDKTVNDSFTVNGTKVALINESGLYSLILSSKLPQAKKLPSGNWRVQASKTVDGKQIRRSFTAPDKRKAELQVAQWLDSVEEYSNAEGITLRQAYERYMEGIQGRITSLSPSAITDSFQRILKKIGLPPFRFHDLRHYAVSTLHAINVPDKYIMARGGWQTNYTMNNVYNHALKSKKDEYENKISSHFNKVYE